MKLAGEQRIAAPRQKVWEALNDPDVLRQCIPGCQSLDKLGEDRLEATAAIKIGPIGARFAGVVTLSDLDPPNGYRITGEGQGGVAGSASGGALVRLADEGPTTLLSYEVEAQVGGRLAQLGGPIIDSTAKQLAGKFFSTFGEIVGAAPEAQVKATAITGTAASKAAATASTGYASPAPAPRGLPMAWAMALAVAALCGFLVGRGRAGAAASDWMGLSIGLLLVVVAAAAFEFGRRAATPVLTLDPALLARLAEVTRR